MSSGVSVVNCDSFKMMICHSAVFSLQYTILYYENLLMKWP